MFSCCALSYPEAGQPRYLVLGCGAGHQNPTVANSTSSFFACSRRAVPTCLKLAWQNDLVKLEHVMKGGIEPPAFPV